MDLLFVKILITLVLGIFAAYGIDNFKIGLVWKIVLSFVVAVLLSTLIIL